MPVGRFGLFDTLLGRVPNPVWMYDLDFVLHGKREIFACGFRLTALKYKVRSGPGHLAVEVLDGAGA